MRHALRELPPHPSCGRGRDEQGRCGCRLPSEAQGPRGRVHGRSLLRVRSVWALRYLRLPPHGQFGQAFWDRSGWDTPQVGKRRRRAREVRDALRELPSRSTRGCTRDPADSARSGGGRRGLPSGVAGDRRSRGTIAAVDGPFFEDISVGATYRTSIGRTITQADNVQFSLLTNNANEIHINAHYAAQTEFKRPLVNSFLTLATVAGMMVPETSRWGCALGVGEVTLPNPLFDGDTLYADTEVLEARASRSRQGWGIVTVRQRGIKQDGTVVLIAKRTFMVPTRANAPKPH